MKRRSRIRAKLLVGLVLVLAISAILTGNTLIGLYSYRSSIKSFEAQKRKLVKGKGIWDSVSTLDDGALLDPKFDKKAVQTQLAERIGDVETALVAYQKKLNLTLSKGQDPDDGQDESDNLRPMAAGLVRLKRLCSGPGAAHLDAQGFAKQVHEEVEQLHQLVTALQARTYEDIAVLIAEAQASYRTNLVIGWSTGVAVLMMLLLLSRQIYRWVFKPIQQLHKSVRRVGRGDMSHRANLRTNDEMQELAEAFNDMTDQIQRTCSNLERQVEERSRELVRSERLASVGFLAAGVAHEINNPLASISLGAESLRDRLREILEDGTESQEIDRYLRMIESEAFRCKGITEKLLDFSRMRHPIKQSTALMDLIAEVLDIVKQVGKYKRKNIVVRRCGAVVAEVNPEEIKQVALNLIVNALDSLDADGTLEITGKVHNGHAEIVFTDNGCGMTEEVIENVFEPFFTRKQATKGTGLGLSISHRIVTSHGGEIEAKSDGPGKGSRFTMRLPVPKKRGGRKSDFAAA